MTKAKKKRDAWRTWVVVDNKGRPVLALPQLGKAMNQYWFCTLDDCCERWVNWEERGYRCIRAEIVAKYAKQERKSK